MSKKMVLTDKGWVAADAIVPEINMVRYKILLGEHSNTDYWMAAEITHAKNDPATGQVNAVITELWSDQISWDEPHTPEGVMGLMTNLQAKLRSAEIRDLGTPEQEA